MLKQEKESCRSYDTDRVAKNTWLTLVRDFRSTEGLEFCRKAERALTANFTEFRLGDVFPERGDIPIPRYKRYAQLENLLKKYRFADDVYTDSQLQDLTLRKYFSEQERLAVHLPTSALASKVMQRARFHARRILGEYSPSDTIISARFGKKSSIGCPLSLAYIDHKLTDARAFSGSSQCATWFRKHVLPEDKLLNQMVDAIPVNWDDENLAHESLSLVNVPKTWKTLRTITPLTLLNLYYSYGYGNQVTERLKQEGLDIRTLQSRHQKLIKHFSLNLSHATADLSAASDSLTTEVLNRVLPREWYCALKPILTHQVEYSTSDGVIRKAYTESVLPMGNGCTFPVETLIFYCLLRALGDLAKVKGVFSVYGDDLIYPSALHKFVIRVFPECGLVLNVEKTYVSFPFRESCGADYFRGCNVRPFFFRGDRQQLTATQYTAFLYKVYNGLIRRWDPLEIPGTLHYLLVEIAQVSREIYRVPPGYPDTAGIKTLDPRDVPAGTWNLPWSPVACLYSEGSRWYKFRFLMSTSARRYIKSVLPYYWLSLQSRNDGPENDNFWDTDYSYLHTLPSSGLTWRNSKMERTYDRGGKTRKVVVAKYSPQCASRVQRALRPESGSISDWI